MPLQRGLTSFSVEGQLTSGQGKAHRRLQEVPHRSPGAVWFAVGPLAEEMTSDVNDRAFDVVLHLAFQSKAAHDRYPDGPNGTRRSSRRPRITGSGFGCSTRMGKSEPRFRCDSILLGRFFVGAGAKKAPGKAVSQGGKGHDTVPRSDLNVPQPRALAWSGRSVGCSSVNSKRPVRHSLPAGYSFAVGEFPSLRKSPARTLPRG